MEVVLRPVTPEDEPFLRRVYASTRAEELAPVPWTDEQKRAFCDLQFAAQDSHYRATWPGATYDVVVVDGEPAGRLWQVSAADEVHVLDVAILPEFRGRGIGTRLLRDVLDGAAATGRYASISVEKFNHRARALYERLGFAVVDETGVYERMEWRAGVS